METPAHETEVVIVGGGLNGLLLALALAQGGVRSTVLDAGPRALREDPEFDGRAYALAVGARRMLTALGLWRELEGQAQPILEIKISDGRAGEGASRFWLHFDHAEIEEGPMG
ncbi:MAG TPA: FAD-dependent monooxygenase, partial [Paracoccaceae bacterium]|nr:FAD-dependent monooxygenase [Paracoccaceae bacterium]